ncbi:MAG TPA: transcription antitermination factor NusB [Solirubrobacterales bacterium]|nr:transcription antitermination factor NusB [Solirubrobacterales bacterium]
MSRVAPARRAAFEVVRRTFEQGAFADRALPAAARRHRLDARDRALAKRLAYGSIQRRGTADFVISRLADRSVEEIDAGPLAALRLGLYELLFAGGTPDHAAVDQAVELAKGGRGAGRPARERGARFVNAVLRRAAREREPLLGELSDATAADAAVALSHPRWLAEMWWRELGPDAARALMAADNEPAETALRVNSLRADPAAALRGLHAEGADVERPQVPPAPPESVVVHGAIGDAVASWIDDGRLVPQSRASALVVEVLDPRPGERVLDLCAGPGIKTTQIAARMRGAGEIVAVEKDPGRAGEVRDLCRVTGAAGVEVRVADAARDDLGGGYDRVLVDPPCSDLGTLASRPDARWRKSVAGIERMAAVAGEIAFRGAAALRPGGTLVYSTCTVSRRENEDQVGRLLGSGHAPLVADDLSSLHPGLASPHDARVLQTRPDRDRTDGFFVARMRRDDDR